MSLPADDLLSAFHDGELNSAECAAVEQRLTTSAEARRELSEIRQVSAILKELPRERLPSEFPLQVLQAIEREMLIPSQRRDDASLLTRESADSAGPSRRWLGAAAVLTSAAGLLLLVRAIDDRTSSNISEVRQVDVVPQKQFAAEDSSSASSFGGGAASPSVVADAPTSRFRNSGVLGGAAGANPITANSPLATRPPPSGVAARESDIQFFDQSALRDAKIGDVVRAMQTEGTEVAVVWLTVVDRQDGLAGLQLLLSGKKMARANSDKRVSRGEKPDAALDQMHAVFVELDAERLTAALKELRDSDVLQSLEVDQPIEIAQLDDVSDGRILAADRLGDGIPAGRAAAKEDAAKVPADASSASRRFTAPSSPIAEKKSASAATTPATTAKAAPAEPKGPQESKDQLAKQIPLEFPRDALIQNQLSQLSRNRGLSRNQLRAPSQNDKNAEKASADQRPMQILFVVVDQAQAGKQISPSNSSKPASNAPVKARSEPAKPADKDGAA